MATPKRRTAASAWWGKCSTICLVTSFVCLAFALQPYFTEVEDTPRQSNLRQLAGSGGVMLIIYSLLSFDLSYLNASGSQSMGNLLMHYGMTRISLLMGKRYYGNFIKGFPKVAEQQKALLMEVLHTNAETEYGKKFEFSKMKSYEDFLQAHPVATYDHFRPFIDEIVEKGTTNMLCKLDPLYLATTSGTTGKPKLIPLNSEMTTSWMSLYPYGILTPLHKGLQVTLCKHLRMFYEPPVSDTPGGLLQSTMSYFLSMGVRKLPNLSCHPMAFDIKKEDTAFYVQAVFALWDRDIGQLETSFASHLLAFWNYMVENAELICKAIETGELTTDIKLPSVKHRVMFNREIKADPERASQIMNELRRGSDGLALRLWPNIQACRVVVTGSQQLYADNLRNTFMKGVPMLTLAHAGSESIYGINISKDVDDYSYALAYNNAFFEFIPEKHCEKQNPAALLAHQLEEGSLYEIVVTTKMGLYRYRTGDVIEVVGYQDQCPIYEFRYRLGQTLNLSWEKTPEHVLQRSMMAAARDLNHVIADFTTTEDVYYHGMDALKQTTRNYVVFLEVEGKKKIPKAKLNKFDEALCAEAEVYASLRRENAIAAMEILQVKPGTFRQLANSIQFKVPRVVRRKDMLNYFKENLL